MSRLGFVASGVFVSLAFLGTPFGSGVPLAMAGDLKAGEAGIPALEPAAVYTQFEAQMKLHLRDKAKDALKKDVEETQKQLTAITDEKLAAKWKTALGTILQGCTDDGVQRAAIKAIGDTKDPSLFRYLRPFLAQPVAKEVPPLLDDAITATGKVVADDAVTPLMGLLKDTKVMAVAQAALKALGNYQSSKRMRGPILRDVISTVRKDQPGIGQRWDSSQGDPAATAKTKTGDEALARWGALSSVMVEALNKLTGQNCATPIDWISLYDKYKNSLDTLFPSTK